MRISFLGNPPARTQWFFAMMWSGLLMAAVPIRIARGTYWKIAGYAACYIVLTAVLRVVARWGARYRPAPCNGQPSRPRWMLPVAASAICAAVWACYGYMFYPGFISADFYVQWHEMAGHIPYSDWHPVFYGLLLRAVTLLWYSPAVVVLAQVLSLTILIGIAAAKLRFIGTPQRVIILMALFYAFFPLFGFYTVSLLKDIAYAILMFWLTLTLLEIVVTDGGALGRTGCVVSLTLSVLGVILVRHNGVIPAAGTMLVLLGVYRTRFRRLILIACLVGLSVILYRGPLLDRLDVVRQGKNGLKAQLPIQHIGAIIAEHGKLGREEEKFLSQILPIPFWQKTYDPRSIMPLISMRDEKGHHYFNEDFLNNEDNYNRFIAMWARLALRHPITILKFHLVGSELAWRISSNYRMWILSEELVETDLYLGRTKKSPPIEERVGPLAFALVRLIKNPSTGWLLHRGALYFLISFFFISLYLVRTRNFRIVVVATPVILQAGTVFAFPLAQNIRYMYPIVLAAPLLTALFFSCYPFRQNTVRGRTNTGQTSNPSPHSHLLTT